MDVAPYKDDEGRRRWAFRCDSESCGGFLSLGHSAEGWARSAQADHLKEHHQGTRVIP